MLTKLLRLLSFAIGIAFITFSCKKDNSYPAPSGLNVTNITDTGCTISWSSVPGAGNYRLTISLDGGFTSPVSGYDELSVSNTSVTVTTLTPYTQYFVKVIAGNDDDYGEQAETDFMTLDADRLVIVPWDNNALYAFDARNGNVKWTFTGVEITSTPIIHDNIVYVGAKDGRLYALYAHNGTEKWKTQTTGTGSFFTSCPFIRDGIVYIGDYGGRFHAYQASNGTSKWYYDVPSPYRNINSSANMRGNMVYFASYDGKIYALDATTGVYKWATVNTGNPISSGMAIVNNTIYVGGSRVNAFDATTGATKWTAPDPQYAGYSSSPTIVNDNVIIGGEDRILYAYDTLNGAINWSKPLGSGSIVSSPVQKNGIIYVGGGDGALYALQSNTGAQVWTNNESGSDKNIYSGPTLSEKTLYSGTLEGKVVATDIQTGKAKWITAIPGARFQDSPSVVSYKGTVYYPGLSGEVQ